MQFIKAEGVHIAITAFAILMGIGGTVIGIGALVDPDSAVNFVAGADDLATSWAGRNLGLGIAMLVAVAMRYAAAFAGAICRELSDVIVEFNVAFFVIMLIEIVCLGICARAVFMQRQAA